MEPHPDEVDYRNKEWHQQCKNNWRPPPSEPQAPNTIRIPPPDAALGEGALQWLLFIFPADTYPPTPASQMFYSWKRGWAVSFLCKELWYEYIFHMLNHEAIGALDPSSSSLADLAGGVEKWLWSSNLSYSCLGFPVRRTLTPFCRQGTDSFTSHSLFQPQDSIGLFLESSGQSCSVTWGF